MQPNLLFPIQCVIQPLDEENTYYDEDLREPIQNEARTQIIIPGQVMATAMGKMSANSSGVTETSDGYIVFNYQDIRARKWKPQLQDRIIKIGFLLTDLYVVALQPMAFRPELNGPGLLKALYRDKQQSRNNPGV